MCVSVVGAGRRVSVRECLGVLESDMSAWPLWRESVSVVDEGVSESVREREGECESVVESGPNE